MTRRQPVFFPLIFVTLLAARPVIAERALHEFRRILLSEEFFSEGACFADIDGDGQNDVISGPYWYAGPDFRTRHAYAPAQAFPIAAYSRHFFSFADDFNRDGRPDILAIPMPGDASHWFENPGRTGSHWKKHVAFDGVDGESPEWIDLTGDGQPELVCAHGGAFGYAEPDRNDPTAPWKFTPVTENRGYGRFTHGLGVGDVNGDRRPDLLETNGWWEHTATRGELFRFHAARFAQAGGAQMFAYDFDGDGDNDVVSTQNAHGHGISWFEQMPADEGISFREHPILTGNPADSPYGLAISQMHAVALADIDDDGVKDIVTGKRFWAHGGRDPGATELSVLYWFRTTRTDAGVRFEPWLIDERSGVGTQLVVGDVSGNGLDDVVVGNKLGTFVMLHSVRHVSDEEYAASRPKQSREPAHTAGTGLFRTHIRATGPLSPAEEKETFVLPPGFEAQLVAAEPDIAKPMNLAFDARGRLWVSSSEEYPFPVRDGRKGKDTIKVLEDTDGDGRADRITTFADGLNIPIGLYPYRDGVICWSIPNIWFLRDTDGDGKADRREVLFGPMGWERDTHGMCNSFTRGLDGWLYACHGFSNHTTVAGRDGHEIRMRSGNTFRMRLDGSRIEHYAHGMVNPFGMTFDHFGDIFTADCHSKPISLVLEGGHHESFGKPHDGLGFVPNIMEHMHGSTALCAIALGHGAVFPAVYETSVFHGNVTSCRINRNSLVYRASSVRAQEEADFLMADDPWFRPVDLQVGPDGALYVADFYNRIIGHYEVPLTHPGRDRHRGRIWRIVYTASDERRDAPPRSPAASDRPSRAHDLTAMSVDELIRELDSTEVSRTSCAIETLVEEYGEQAVDAARRALRDGRPTIRAHSLWLLYRLDALGAEEIESSLEDEASLVRIHAQRVIAAWSDPPPRVAASIRAGFDDAEPLVRRAAALAAAKHACDDNVRPLIDLHHATPHDDVHLRHAIRMALREHLVDEAQFAALRETTLSRPDSELIAGLCLALKTPGSAEFLVAHLETSGGIEPAQLAEYMKFSARHVSSDSITSVVAIARRRFANDSGFQRDLLRAVHTGLGERGVEPPPAVREWALDLARDLLGLGEGESVTATRTLSWTFSPYPGTPDHGNPWVLSTRRRSSDGLKETPLYSSFPRGEPWTGIYRSEAFELPSSLSFFVAGHDGHPSRPLRGKNVVQLRHAATREILRQCDAPRSDIAQRIVWDTSPWKGERAHVELVDGDTNGAYAWLAVGRFSIAGLNPSRLPERRREAAALAGEFRLNELREPLADLLRHEACDRETSVAVARAIVRMNPDARLAALADVPAIAGVTVETRRRALALVVDGKAPESAEVLGEAMKGASAAEQLHLAERLSSDAAGADVLLSLVESGHTAASILKRRRVAQKLAVALDDARNQRLAQLTEDLPDEAEELAKLIAQRKEMYLARAGSRDRGAELFKKNCGVCHQVAGEGKDYAPQLDGIGNRGLDRLVEDILAPNRNVDVAFRSTTVITRQGMVYNGLVRPSDGAQLILVDSEGKESAIPVDSILEKIPSRLSPMPANFGEALGEEELRHLLTYLLSLQSS